MTNENQTMRFRVKTCIRWTRFAAIALLAFTLTGCDDPQVYGSIGVSSGYSSYRGGYGGYSSGPRMHGSITVGGRIM